MPDEDTNTAVGASTSDVGIPSAESESLAQIMTVFAGEVKGLREVIEAAYIDARANDKRNEKIRRRSRNALIVVFFALLLNVAATAFAVQTSQGNREVIQRFDECTQPGTEEDPHECYDDAQERQAAAVQELLAGHEARNQRLVDAFNAFFHEVDPTLPDVVLEHPGDDGSG